MGTYSRNASLIGESLEVMKLLTEMVQILIQEIELLSPCQEPKGSQDNSGA